MKVQVYCSKECMYIDRQKPSIKCTGCDQLIRWNRKFCSSSCSTSYNNKNRNYGYRQSAIEQHLANELIKAGHTVICNSKDYIGSELDIFLPKLNKAIEVNGVFHYKPIYGEKKLKQIQTNDKLKIIECNKHGINLLVLDVSDQNQFTEANSKVYLNKVIQWVDREAEGSSLLNCRTL